MISEYETGIWARVNCLDAGLNRGAFFRPDINDEVLLGFIDDDPRHPVVLGMLNSSANPAPIQATDDNPRKGFVTKQGLKFMFNDQLKEISLETLEGNTIVINEEEKKILIKDSNQNSIEMNQEGISLESASNISISAAGDIDMEGVNITFKASGELKGEGSAGAELSASGNTIIKGATVMIN